MPDAQIAPTEGKGGAVPEGSEYAEKGGAAQVAADGIVPAELGGSDAPEEILPPEPELGNDVSGAFASDPNVTATEGGVDLTLGDNADATSIGGAGNVEGTPQASAVQTRPDPDAVD